MHQIGISLYFMMKMHGQKKKKKTPIPFGVNSCCQHAVPQGNILGYQMVAFFGVSASSNSQCSDVSEEKYCLHL